jgi:hypothetical protein
MSRFEARQAEMNMPTTSSDEDRRFTARAIEAAVRIGALGGFIRYGIVGLFVGAIIFTLGYSLFVAWLEAGTSRGGAESNSLPAR